jgi:hypothetical protein
VEKTGFIASAPKELIGLCGQINNGKQILYRLLTDKRMSRPWRVIDRRILDLVPAQIRKSVHTSRRGAYRRLWGEIITSLHTARRPIAS